MGGLDITSMVVSLWKVRYTVMAWSSLRCWQQALLQMLSCWAATSCHCSSQLPRTYHRPALDVLLWQRLTAWKEMVSTGVVGGYEEQQRG